MISNHSDQETKKRGEIVLSLGQQWKPERFNDEASIHFIVWRYTGCIGPHLHHLVPECVVLIN